MPSWRVIADKMNGSVTYQPIYDKNRDIKQEEIRHKTEVELITSYSPFSTEEQLLGKTKIFIYQIVNIENCIHLVEFEVDKKNSFRTILRP